MKCDRCNVPERKARWLIEVMWPRFQYPVRHCVCSWCREEMLSDLAKDGHHFGLKKCDVTAKTFYQIACEANVFADKPRPRSFWSRLLFWRT